MSTIVVKASQTEAQALLKFFKAYQVPAKNEHMLALLKPDGATISLYKSGKVMFQGQKADDYARQAGFEVKTETAGSHQAGQDFPIIGTDEVGNGSYFGGLAVVASFVTPENHAYLKSLGVNDSKKMTDARILAIAPELKQTIKHQALLLSPKKYNEVIASGYNAVSVKVALHNQAIFLLLQQGVKPQQIVIDAFTSSHNYKKYLAKESNQFDHPISLIEKAEGRYLAVAVSSILARSLFLDNLDQLSQQIGYHLPSGAGAKSDQVAANILTRYGMDGLNRTAKLHFANTQKAQKIAQRK